MLLTGAAPNFLILSNYSDRMPKYKYSTVTYDHARPVPGSTEVSTSGFGDAIIAGLKET